MNATSSAETMTTVNASVVPKACENCRIRKIRCNRVIPCSNCENSGIICRPASKTIEPRSRISLSTNYEKQIEQINDRLGGIEDALLNLRLTKASASPNDLPDSIKSLPTSTSDAAQSQIATPAAFEGASSFTSQALQASKAAGLSLGSIASSADVIDALSSLNNLGRTPGIRQDMRLGNAASPRNLPDIELLPAHFVLSLLQEFRNRHATLFLAYAFRDHKQIERLCQQVYFPTEPVSVASLTLMNGMLLYMIKELFFDGNYGLCKDFDLRCFHDQAEKNFHLGVETYEIFAHPSLESAKVLMLAMLKSQEEGKPLLTWTFASTGSRQVISLGYHREACLKNDSPDLAEEKRQVFWTFYIDKNLSLNMGYSSTIQDYDIDIGYFKCSTDPGVRPWDRAALATIDISRIQGLIYEKLYSLQALSSSPTAKAQVINDLSPRLERWRREWAQEVHPEEAYLPTCFFLIYGAFDVVYYSVMTTLHRAASPSHTSVEITSACYEAAKKSLQAHLHFFPAFKSYGDAEILATYVAWILLYASWTPLIVVFLHAIASSSEEDVKLLEETEVSLLPLKDLSQQSEQVYNLCRIFHKLAKAFVEQNSTFVGTYNSLDDTIVMPQSDIYPRDSAFMSPPPMHVPQSTGPGLEQVSALSFGRSEMNDMSMFLGNWLGGNAPVSQLWSMDFTTENSIEWTRTHLEQASDEPRGGLR